MMQSTVSTAHIQATVSPVCNLEVKARKIDKHEAHAAPVRNSPSSDSGV